MTAAVARVGGSERWHHFHGNPSNYSFSIKADTKRPALRLGKVSRAHWGKPGLFGENDTTGLVHSDTNHTTEHLRTVFLQHQNHN